VPKATVKGVELAYLDTRTDEDPAVVFVHGFPLSARMWEQQLLGLGSAFRLIAPDLKGFGNSSVPEDLAAYSMDAWADELAALLDELDLDRVVLCGLSMGGYIAFAFHRRHADRLAGLVLADTRADADSPEAREKRTKQQQLVRERGAAPLAEVLAPALMSEYTRRDLPDVYARVKMLMEDHAPAGVIGALEAMKNRPDSTADLATIHVPTLVMVGEKDMITPPDVARSVADKIAGAQLVMIPTVGHLPNLEAPDVFNAELAAFLQRLDV
jgi:3-oxoadipate enol-lactonase